MANPVDNGKKYFFCDPTFVVEAVFHANFSDMSPKYR